MPGPKNPQYRYVGKNTTRKDARAIVTGSAVYTDDVQLGNTLYGKLLYGRTLKCPYPHARIVSIDISEAEKVPGVHAVLTKDNLKPPIDTWMLGLPPFRPVLAEVCQFVGDAVALVAAETPEQAEEACDLIKVEYEVLHPILTMEEAMDPSSEELYPQLIDMHHAVHEDHHNEIPKHFVGAGELFMTDLFRGDPDKAFEESAYIVEDEAEYMCLPSPMAAEPPGIVATCDANNHFEVWATSQGSHFLKMMCEYRMKPHADMDVTTVNVGGSFGNKQSMQTTLAYTMMLAAACKQPVKIMQTKEEQLLCHDLRLGSKIHVKVGMTKDGYVNAVKGHWYVDSGAVSDTHHVQLGVGLGEMQLALCKCQNWEMIGHMVVTNHDMTGSVRGFGGQELKASLLPTVMKLVEKADMDPVEFFAKNYCETGDTYLWREGSFVHARETDYKPALYETAEKFGWKDKWVGWGKPYKVEGTKAYGIGVAVHGNADVGEDNDECYVRLTRFGEAYVHASITEAGMGQRNNCLKMVAEVLNMDFDKVKCVDNSTKNTPWSFGLAGSRGTLTIASACVRAAEDAKRKLIDRASAVMHISAEELDTENGFVFQKGAPQNRVPWVAVIQPYGTTITGEGNWRCDYSHPNFCAFFADVEVDLETGLARLVDAAVGSDVGQNIDPATLEMQFHGGFGSAGTDTALNEEHIFDFNTGRFVTHNLIDYKWRTFNDFPPFATVIQEGQPNISRFKAVGFGEIAGSPGPSAIMMAISNAIGTHFDHYPATPDAILKAMGKVK